MITSSITAQCCPLHIIHNVTYTMGEIHSYSYSRRPQSRNSTDVELGIDAIRRREINDGQRSRKLFLLRASSGFPLPLYMHKKIIRFVSCFSQVIRCIE